MKNKTIRVLLVIIIISASLISLCACGRSTAGTEPKSLQLFHGKIFTLPIASIMRTEYSHVRNLKSNSYVRKENLSELFDLLCSASHSNSTYTLYDNYIYVEVKTANGSSGAVIKYNNKKGKKYYYTFRNLSSVLEYGDTQLPIMTPDHLMENFSKVENHSVLYIIYCNQLYQAKGSIEEFEAFYVKNGYSVERTDNTLNITDTSIEYINENAIYCDIPEEISFKITFENGYVKYTV